MQSLRLRESAGHSAFIDSKIKMMGYVLAESEQKEKGDEIPFCCMISRLAQNAHLLKCLFNKIKLFTLSNKLYNFNKEDLDQSFANFSFIKGEITSYLCANKDQLYLRDFVKLLVNFQSGKNQSSILLDA